MPVAPRRNRADRGDQKVMQQPADFSEMWSIVKDLRETKDAPVDLWGCDKVVDTKAPKDVFEFQTLIAAMLSSQTKDQCVKQGMDNLLKSDLSVSGVLSLTEDEIDEKIKMVGFHRTKARNIRQVAHHLKENHCGRVPQSFDELITLPGVGPKMANLVMSCAFNESSGICVDTHVHRICTLLGWGCKRCKPQCKQPEHTREILEQWVPKQMWREFTYLLVGLGQQSQSQRQLLLDRCLRLKDAEKGIKFLRRIKFNFNNLVMETNDVEPLS
jgi:endonuclease-3